MSRAWAGGSTAAWRRVRAAVLARDGYRCQVQLDVCTTVATTADHIVAKSRGGTDHPDNLRAACAPCNQARGDRPDDPAPSGRW